MALSTSSPPETLPIDRYTQILKLCAVSLLADTTAQKRARLTSLKLDLRVIQEVEGMEGYATDEDFDELLCLPKMRDFMAQTKFDPSASKSFWTLARMHYLGTLTRAQRAQVIQINHQTNYKTAAILAELYRLTTVQERLRLLSRLPYMDYAAVLAEVERRALSLRADGGVFLSSIAHDRQSREVRNTARRTFFAR